MLFARFNLSGAIFAFFIADLPIDKFYGNFVIFFPPRKSFYTHITCSKSRKNVRTKQAECIERGAKSVKSPTMFHTLVERQGIR